MNRLVKKIAAVITGTVLQTAGAYSPVCAEGREIRLGHLQILPSLTVQEVYDDNIYYGNGSNRTTELKESDWINHTKPGLLLEYTLDGRGDIRLGYDGDFARYANNSFNNWSTNRGMLDIDYRAPGGLIAKLNNLFIQAEDPYGAPNEYGLGRKKKRWTDSCEAVAGFKFSSRFKVLTFYNFFKQRYASRLDFTQNYTSGEIGAGGEVKVADKTWLFLRYYYGSHNYDTHLSGITSSNDASYSWKKVATGLTWDSEARFEGEVNMGYQWNSFDNSHDQNNQPYKNTSSWVAATSVRFLQTASRTFTVALARNFQIQGAGQSGYSTNTSLGIGVRQKIMSRYLLEAGYGYAKNKYSNSGDSGDSGRKDPIHTARISFRYLISDWLAAGIDYNFIKNNSNISPDRYTVNRIGITLDINPSFLHNDNAYWRTNNE
jgi:hypothetical protein